MLMWMIIISSVVCVGLVAGRFLRGSTVTAATDHAIETGNLRPLVIAIEKSPEREQATHFDQAIKALWQAYARHAAALLVVEAAQRTDSNIVQYWIRKVIEVEPEIAEECFSSTFMAEYFRPEIAAQCGAGCGCG